ncbi:MAG: M48 family metallopeptidase [Deltaproteobacteria bacterium]|nr:M48 family metallopeptidase [Deltaproteobacteria bacterium]
MLILGSLVALILARVAAQLWLNALNVNEASRWASEAPSWLAGAIEEDRRRKSVDYTLARAKVSAFDIVYDAAILSVVVFSGLLPRLYSAITGTLGTSVWVSAAYVVVVGIVLSIPGLPLDAWVQFRLEERFGFNRTTVRLWIVDRIKGLVLGIVIGYPLLCVVLGLIQWTGRMWWLWGFVVMVAFQLVMLVLFPKVILPMFNKLEPLPDGSLKQRLIALAGRCGFQVSAIQVMDGSKRSTHSNAFFTGLGRFRRIVLFDTLIASMTEEQIEAVLAHEIGHSKKGHVIKGLILSILVTLVGFGVLGLLVERPWLYDAFGFAPGQVAPLLVLIGLTSGLATFWLTPLGNAISRKHEYEADAYARQAVGTPTPLVEALTRLAESNLSNLTPHPWYSGFYYSHPTWVERRAALLREGAVSRA